jgi:hypothetical protein
LSANDKIFNSKIMQLSWTEIKHFGINNKWINEDMIDASISQILKINK